MKRASIVLTRAAPARRRFPSGGGGRRTARLRGTSGVRAVATDRSDLVSRPAGKPEAHPAGAAGGQPPRVDAVRRPRGDGGATGPDTDTGSAQQRSVEAIVGRADDIRCLG